MLRLDLDPYRIAPGQHPGLAKRRTAETGGLGKEAARAQHRENRRRLAELQERLYAEGTRSLLLVLQAMDTGGKDSTIRSVLSGVNPQGCQVVNFKVPTPQEKAHDFLWRVHARVPPHGYLGVFNRSHYEDVLIVRVHGWASPAEIEARYDHINAFERLLADGGTRLVKVMLHISKGYQLERLRRRLQKPDKHWKFNPKDLDERARWADYMAAYEAALARCSTEAAPWFVVPAEKRWYRNLVVGQLLVDTLEDMAPRFPPPAFDPADYPPEALR